MRKNSHKNSRVNSDVQRVLSHIISQEIKDPRISPMTSVMEVIVAPDLKTCKIYVSVFGDDAACDDTLAGLKSASGYIRKQLAQSLNLRNTPELTFIMDKSISYGVDMIKKINDITKDLPDEVEDSDDDDLTSDDDFE